MCGDRRHQPVSKRKEKQTYKKICRLQITEAGMRMFKGKSVNECAEGITKATGLDRPSRRQYVEALRISIQTVHEGGKAVIPTYRPPLRPPPEIIVVLISAKG
jgi:hypothetical protein